MDTDLMDTEGHECQLAIWSGENWYLQGTKGGILFFSGCLGVQIWISLYPQGTCVVVPDAIVCAQSESLWYVAF